MDFGVLGRWVGRGSIALAAAAVPAGAQDEAAAIRRELHERVAALEKQVAALPSKLTQDRDGVHALALLALPGDMALRMERGGREWDVDELASELRRGEALAAALERGEIPRAPGPLRRVHRLASTGELVPYSLYVPKSLPSDGPAPLLVALHGLGAGDESFFAYGAGTLAREVERRGWLVVAPLGWRKDSFYRGPGEEDVLAVMDEATKEFRVDPTSVWLIGHSMGGFGTLRIAANHPERFAAIAPISGGGPAAWLEPLRDVPALLVHGDADRLVPVDASRTLFELARSKGMPWEFLELPGANHVNVVAQSLPRVLDFLDRHRKPRR